MLPPLSTLHASSMLALLLAAATAMARPAPDTLEQRIKACTACHATDNEKRDAFFPRIAGKPAGYLYNQLRNFRNGHRNYPVMVYMVANLPEPYLREIADYFAAALGGLDPPHDEPFVTATLTPMARSFYGENKRVRNRLIREELGVALAYPTYREGLQALKDDAAG